MEAILAAACVASRKPPSIGRVAAPEEVIERSPPRVCATSARYQGTLDLGLLADRDIR